MVDTENIGGINVAIEGDYSPLVAAFSTAEDLATKAGTDIANALADGAASGADAAQQISDQLSTISPAADDAAESLAGTAAAADDLSSSADGATESTQQLGEAAGESSSKLAEMAEQLTAIGEALVVTEGLKELGSEALGAADNVTHASIALTVLTGDSEVAQSTIEGLEKLGMADGLSFPSLLTAATRMTAMLPPGTDVTTLLGHIADGAAITGTSVEQAANRFDMITNAGTLSARALTSMGLSLPAVAAAMNTVTGTGDATAQSVTAMFKAMDPGQRIQVLQTALSGLGGTAQQVAEQTFGGQWQQLVNQWDALMVQAGQALLPFVTQITDFLKLDVVPFLQGMVDAWKELPVPIQDATIVIGLMSAAVVPLVGGLAAIGLAMNGLEGVVPAVTGLLALFGTTAAETAVEEDVAAASTATLGEASEVAGAEMGTAGIAAGSLGAIMAGVLVAGIVAAGIAFVDWKARVDAAHASLTGLTDNDLKAYLAGIGTVEQGTGNVGTATDQFTAKLATLKEALDRGVISAAQYAAAVKSIDDAQKQVDIAGFSSELTGLGVSIHLVGAAAQATVTQQQLLDQTVTDAQAKVDALTKAYQGTEGQAAALLAAQKSLQSATDALNASLGPVPGTMEAINAAATKLASSQESVSAKTATATSMQDAQNAQLLVAQNAYDVAAAKLQLLDGQVQNWTAAQDGSAKAAQQLLQAQNDLSTQISVVTKAQNEYQQVLAAVTAKEDQQAQQTLPTLLDAYRMMANDMGPVMAAFTGIAADIDTVSAALPNFGIKLAANTAQWTLLQSAVDEAKAKLAGYQAQMDAGTNVSAQYLQEQTKLLNAQIALDQENAVAALGLQGMTDAISLQTDAVASAQAKYNDLVAAFANGLTTFDKVEAAQKALDSAQKTLNATLDAAPGYWNAATAAESTFTAQSATTNTALASQVTQVDALAASVSALTGDWLGLDSAQSKTSGAGGSVSGGGAGYSSSWTGMGTFGQNTYSVSYTPNISSAQLQQEIDSGDLSYAQALATVADLNSLGYSDSYTLKPKGSASAATATATSPATSTAAASPAVAGVAVTSSSQAVNGGTYPDVTAHQAAGEIWAVSLEAASTTVAAAASAASSTDASSIAGSSALTASAVASAADTISNVVGQLQNLTSTIGTVAGDLVVAATASKNSVGQLQNLTGAAAGTAGATIPVASGGSNAVGGFINTQQPGQGAAGAPTAAQYQQQASAAAAAASAAGVPWDGSVPWDGLGRASAAPAAAGVGIGAGSGISVAALNVDLRNANFGGMNPSQIQSSIAAGVTASLVQSLRTAGARF